MRGQPRRQIGLGGGVQKWADVESGSGTTELVFADTVAQPDRTASAGAAVIANSLQLNGGAITSTVTRKAATLSHAGLGSDPKHKVDWYPDSTALTLDGVTVDNHLTETNKGRITLHFRTALNRTCTPAASQVQMAARDATSWGAPSNPQKTGTEMTIVTANPPDDVGADSLSNTDTSDIQDTSGTKRKPVSGFEWTQINRSNPGKPALHTLSMGTDADAHRLRVILEGSRQEPVRAAPLHGVLNLSLRF